MSRSPYIKVFDFSATIYPHIYNLAFGDLLPEGGIDDTVVSNIRKSKKRRLPPEDKTSVYIVTVTDEKTTLFPEKLAKANELLRNAQLLD